MKRSGRAPRHRRTGVPVSSGGPVWASQRSLVVRRWECRRLWHPFLSSIKRGGAWGGTISGEIFGAPPISMAGPQTRETSTPPTVKRNAAFFLHPNRAPTHSRRRPPSRSQARNMNGRDGQADCRRQRNNTGLPPPERTHKGQRVPQIAQQTSRGKCRHRTENRNFPHETVPLPPPPPV